MTHYIHAPHKRNFAERSKKKVKKNINYKDLCNSDPETRPDPKDTMEDRHRKGFLFVHKYLLTN